MSSPPPTHMFVLPVVHACGNVENARLKIGHRLFVTGLGLSRARTDCGKRRNPWGNERGSDGTRTRDLQRDRPITALPS